MKILFDARFIDNKYSGLGRYTKALLEGIISNISSLDKLVIIVNNYDELPLFESKKINVIVINTSCYGILKHFFFPKGYNEYIYIYPHFDPPIFLRYKTYFIVHDLLPLIIEDYIIKFKTFKKFYFRLNFIINNFKQNRFCLAVSENTKNDIMLKTAYKKQVKVLYESNVLEKSNKNYILTNAHKNFILYVGDGRSHKNINEIIKIFRKLKIQHKYNGQLILVGNIQQYLSEDLDKYNDVIFKTNISDTELIDLYKTCEAFIFISKYEGFGLPILEAAKYGKKIITSNNSSLTEISPSWALQIDPFNINNEIVININNYIKEEINIEPSDYYFNNLTWDMIAKSLIKKIIN